MEQPTPTITRADVERVVRRDFPSGQYEDVMSVLAEYGETWHREPDRVQLAVLKLAAGKLDALRQNIKIAKEDYRDVLAGAEYPAYMEKTSSDPGLSPAERRKIMDEDWRQYESWLNA